MTEQRRLTPEREQEIRAGVTMLEATQPRFPARLWARELLDELDALRTPPPLVAADPTPEQVAELREAMRHPGQIVVGPPPQIDFTRIPEGPPPLVVTLPAEWGRQQVEPIIDAVRGISEDSPFHGQQVLFMPAGVEFARWTDDQLRDLGGAIADVLASRGGA